MKAHLQTMARYNAWANARVYGAAAELADEAYRRDVGAFFGSLHGTLNHLMVTDRIWMRRFTGEGDHPARLDAIMFDDLESLAAARRVEDARIRRYVDALTEQRLHADLDYRTTKGVAHRNPLGQLLAHLFNHQTHHRGQAHGILTALGVAQPPSLDLLGMIREPN